MVKSLNFDVKIIAGDTQRESDGLALSSRNSNLTPELRAMAPQLYQALNEIPSKFSQDIVSALEESYAQRLGQAGFRCEYLAIRDADNLQKIEHNTKNIVVLAAVWLGSTRLIDNILFPRP